MQVCMLSSRVVLSEKENIDPNVMMAVLNEKKVSSCRVVNVVEEMKVRAEEMATDSMFTMKPPKHLWNLVKKEMDTKHETGWVGLQRDQFERQVKKVRKETTLGDAQSTIESYFQYSGMKDIKPVISTVQWMVPQS
jgi:hypothetical protein